MNVLHAYTRRCLKKNRVRTIMTIIGIALSVAMFTAVTEAAASAFEYLVSFTKINEGSYHALFSAVSGDEYKELAADERMETVGRLSNEGYAALENLPEYDYIYLAGMDEKIAELMPVAITDGRMPENENEVLIPTHLRNKDMNMLKLGEELELELGRRMYDGQMLNQLDGYHDGESVEVRESRTVKIVGFYYRLPTQFESYDTPGFTVLTVDRDGSPYDEYLTAFSLKKSGDIQKVLDDYVNFGESCANGHLLAYQYSSLKSDTMKIIYSFAAVLILIIVFGSVALIYNSFAISVSERTRQFGLLKSIGATRRQVIDSVVYEAMTLCVIGIPLGILAGCVGIGITFSALGDSMGLLFSLTDKLAMKLIIKPTALLAAALIGLITTLISAMIPALRAAKLTPIEAIRQSGDIKITGRQVKSRALVRKLFGFEGDLASKNFRRNRKRYRAVVISLFSSIVLFIAASSFCSYLTKSVDTGEGRNEADIIVTQYDDNMEGNSFDALFETMKAAPHIDSGTMTYFYPTDFTNDANYVNNETAGDPETSGYMIFLDDESFRELCREYKVDAEQYFSDEAVMGLVLDKKFGADPEEAVIYPNEKPETMEYSRFIELPGYTYLYTVTDYDETIDDVVKTVVFAETDYLGYDRYGQLIAPEENLLRLPESEALERVPMTVGDVIHDHITDYYGMEVYLPASRMETATRGLSNWMNMKFRAQDYMMAEEEIMDILSETGYSMGVENRASGRTAERALMKVINVMAYGFIILISLIALVNVFNTISTSIILRRREFAMLRSVGMTRKGFNRMMNYECLLYGVKSVAAGVPVSILISWLIYKTVVDGGRYSLPWLGLAVAVGSVFAVVFITMIYATQRIKGDDTIETLRSENI